MIPINIQLIDYRKYPVKCPYDFYGEEICVHNTANNASAQQEVDYMHRNDKELSFHFAIDDKEVIQGIPLDHNTWHAGDGANGRGNRKAISIEICYSLNGGERFIKAEQLSAKFIAQLLKERNWGIDKVKKHQDYSGKYCPHRTLDMGWSRFLGMIQTELDLLNSNQENVSRETLYRVQVGAFSELANAERLCNELQSKGYQAFIKN